MNRKQKIVLWVGICVAVLMGLFPPWVWRIEGKDQRLRLPKGYQFIATPVWPTGSSVSSLIVEIDNQRLTIQFFLVAIVTGALVWTLATSRDPMR